MPSFGSEILFSESLLEDRFHNQHIMTTILIKIHFIASTFKAAVEWSSYFPQALDSHHPKKLLTMKLFNTTTLEKINITSSTETESSSSFFFILAAVYSLTGFLTLIQLARIRFQMHINQWTMQKGFQLLNVLICVLRAASLFAYGPLHDSTRDGLLTVATDFTSLLFFTTYSMLILFWADIVHTAIESRSPFSPWTIFVFLNFVGYITAAIFWSLCVFPKAIYIGRHGSSTLIITMDLIAVLGFLYYGGKLLKLLQSATIQSITLLNKVCSKAKSLFEDKMADSRSVDRGLHLCCGILDKGHCSDINSEH